MDQLKEALQGLLDQVYQMQGLLDSEDEELELAIANAERALEEN